jgi:hypothetical protein
MKFTTCGNRAVAAWLASPRMRPCSRERSSPPLTARPWLSVAHGSVTIRRFNEAGKVTGINPINDTRELKARRTLLTQGHCASATVAAVTVVVPVSPALVVVSVEASAASVCT